MIVQHPMEDSRKLACKFTGKLLPRLQRLSLSKSLELRDDEDPRTQIEPPHLSQKLDSPERLHGAAVIDCRLVVVT